MISVSGMNWVAQQFAATGHPAVASMSLSGLPSTPLDDGVAAVSIPFPLPFQKISSDFFRKSLQRLASM